MRKRLLFIFLLLYTLAATAQEPFYIHCQTFDERDGYKVFEKPEFITQDNKGLLWIASDNGLFSFDGSHFKNYRHRRNDSTSVPANRVVYNYQDKAGTYWTAVPGHGLYNFHPQTGTFSRFRYNNQHAFNIHGQRLSLPMETKDGTLWFPLPNYGLARYDRQQNRVTPFKICPPESCGSYYNTSLVTRLAEDPNDGTLWAVSNDGLIHFFPSKGQYTVYRDESRTRDKRILGQVYTALFFDNRQQLWLGSWGFGLKKFNPRTKSFEEYRWTPVITGTKNICYGIGQYDANNLWINTIDAGLIVFNTSTHQFRTVRKNGDNSEPLLTQQMVQNSTGVLWLANRKNIIRINPAENFFTFYSLEKMFDKTPTAQGVYSFIRHGNSLFMGVLHDGYLAEYNFRNHRYKIYNPFPNLMRGVRCLAKDHQGNIWVGGSTGITIFDPNTKSFRKPVPPYNLPRLFGMLTYAIQHDHDGTIWLGTEEGLIHYNPEQKKARRFTYDTVNNKPVSDNKYFAHTYTLYKDSQGNIWFGNAVIGLGCYRRATNEVFFFDKARNKNYPEGNCTSITESTDGSILFAVEFAGLSVLKNPFTRKESISVLNASDGLPSDDISRVFKDKRNNIWLFTANGLCWFDAPTGRIRRFGMEDGLAETIIRSKPYQDEDGNMYLGFGQSFQAFNPQHLLASREHRGFIHLASLQVSGKDWPRDPAYVSSLRLTHKQNNIVFEFAFLSPNHTPGFHYAYKLDGLEKDWNHTNDKTFGQYNNLSPGRYTLCIRAMNRNGGRDKSEYALSIIIKPPWHGTVWFYSLIGLLAAGVIYALFRYRISRLRHENKLKAEFTKKLHKTEMRALRAQMNPHFIFNCLNSINRYIVKSDHKTASGYLTRFAKLIRLILDNSANDTITLDKEIQTLQLYIDMEKLRFDNVFDYSIKLDEGICAEAVSLPSMLLQPYVENAIWHGLLHRETHRGQLRISFHLSDEILTAVVEDNGIGRKKAKELKSKEVIKNKSHGMKISGDRIALINELYNLNAAVKVDDLMNDRGDAQGTRVTITIPIKSL